MTLTAARDRCLHCHLPVGDYPRGSFCCSGCEAVYRLLHEEGLTDYYKVRPGSGLPPASRKPDSLSWLDPLLADLPAEEVHRLKLDLQGIHCAACVWLLEKTFKRKPWGLSIRINPALGTVELSWRSHGDIREWIREVERYGYAFGPHHKKAPGASRSLLVRLGVTAALATQVMMITLGFYTGLAPADGLVYTALGWVVWALATAAVAVGGPVFFVGAYRGLRSRLLHLDLPIAAGILLAYAGSTVAYFRFGPEQAYFDSLAVFMTLMLTGRWLQNRVLEKNRNALLADTGVDGLVTRRFGVEGVRAVPAAEVSEGDRLWIVPGELVPVACTLDDSHGRISMDWINGESDPREVAAGAEVPAGAFNASQHPLAMTAREAFRASTLHELLSAGQDPRGKDPGGLWWDRIARWYVALVFVFAAGALLVWLPAGTDEALQVTVAVLVVTCPCALGLAVPLAQELALHGLRRRGIFVRNPSFLDKALRIRKVVFDKTGTLTFGGVTVDEASRASLEALAPQDRRVLAMMTAASNHPVSRALHREVNRGPVAAVGSVREEPGGGLTWTADGHEYRLGSSRFTLGVAREGTLFTRDGALLAEFHLVEDMKPDAPQEIAALSRRGIEVHLMSGDRDAKVEAAARTLGLAPGRWAGDMSPADKARRVSEMDAQDTLMVGDGINDSPVFGAAYAAATPAVDRPTLPAKADFYFTGERVGGVRAALAAAGNLRRVMRLNLLLAVVYNAAALTLCYAGWVTPLLAAVLMPLSSLGIVLLTTTRLREGGPFWRL